MVQIRPLQMKAPSTFKFWGRAKVRLRRPRHLLNERHDRSGRQINRLNGAHGGRGVAFNLQKIKGRSSGGLFGFSQSWGLGATGRWLRLARKKFLRRLRESGLVNGTVKALIKHEKSVQNMLTCSDFEARKYTERSWGLGKFSGKVASPSWARGMGRRSFRARQVGDDEKTEEQIAEGKWIDEGTAGCGCTGGLIWRFRGSCRNFLFPGLQEMLMSEEEEMQPKAMASFENQATLPDDIIEMCLARTPFASLMKATAVCKRWKALTSSPHFYQLRRSVRNWDPWLFLFGLSRNGACLGQMQALDPSSGKWHAIKAEILAGRQSYTVTAVGSMIYIVGGRASSLPTTSGRSTKDSLKTLKSVLRYSPLTGSWKKVCPLNTERAEPIVGVLKVRDRRKFSRDSTDKESGRFESGHFEGRNNLDLAADLYCGISSPRRRTLIERNSRRGEELAVYGGEESQERESAVYLRRSGRFSVMDESAEAQRKDGQEGVLDAQFKNLDVQGSQAMLDHGGLFGLITVGGQGTWDQQLDSAEIYDPLTDSWTVIASLPADHGTPCAGVVCKNIFYVYSELNKLAAYDIEREGWHSIQVSKVPARLVDYAPKLVSCKGRIFLLGVTWGMMSDTGSEMATRTIWELRRQPTSADWVSVSQHPDAPLDWNAVFVGDDEMIFGVEMFKIFGQMLDFVTVCKISGSGAMIWERGSRMEMAMHEIDPSSCITKTATVVRL